MTLPASANFGFLAAHDAVLVEYGKRFVDLLIENEIAVRKRPVELWEIDESTFLSGSKPAWRDGGAPDEAE